MKDYDPYTAPSIAVPRNGHTRYNLSFNKVTTSSINPKPNLLYTNARDVIARDIKELRRVYPDIPNSQLKELISLNKKCIHKLGEKYEK